MESQAIPHNNPDGSIISGKILSLVTVCLDGRTAGELKKFIGSVSLVRLQAQLHSYIAEDYDAPLDRVLGGEPEVCIVDFDQDRKKAGATAERIHLEFPHTAIFAISSNSQTDLVIDAMRSGCKEYLIKPLGNDQLVEAIARVGGRKREKREPQAHGQVLTFLGAKGGCGVTTITTHLGAILANNGSRKVLLVDVHPSLGDGALYLGMTKQQYNFYQLAASVRRLDADLLQSFLLHHPSGLDILPAPEGGEPSQQVTPEAVVQTVEFLRSRYEFVLVDCPPGLSQENIELIHRSDQVYLVTVAEVSALRNVSRYLEYFVRMNMPSNKVRVVLNRQAKKAAITSGEIEKALQCKIFWSVPNQYEAVIQSINRGDPLSRDSESIVSKNLRSWAELVGKKDEPESEKKPEGRSFLGLRIF